MCECNEETGEVCAPCRAIAEKTIHETSAYIEDFIKKRFPSGLDGVMKRIISECILDSFYDGARWAEATRSSEKPNLIILPGQ